MEFLYNWADAQEGVVKTQSWGYCTSMTCRHESHDGYFEYPVTLIDDAYLLWVGDYGERIFISASGRAFYTRKTYREAGYAPVLKTVELRMAGDKPVIPRELVEELKVEYGSSLRHERLLELASVAIFDV